MIYRERKSSFLSRRDKPFQNPYPWVRGIEILPDYLWLSNDFDITVLLCVGRSEGLKKVIVDRNDNKYFVEVWTL